MLALHRINRWSASNKIKTPYELWRGRNPYFLMFTFLDISTLCIIIEKIKCTLWILGLMQEFSLHRAYWIYIKDIEELNKGTKVSDTKIKSLKKRIKVKESSICSFNKKTRLRHKIKCGSMRNAHAMDSLTKSFHKACLLSLT